MAAEGRAGKKATADQLRAGIDRGQAGDKVPFPDPAAAPLGTDDEAAGQPPSPASVARAEEQELTRPPVPAPPVKSASLPGMIAALALLALIGAVLAVVS